MDDLTIKFQDYQELPQSVVDILSEGRVPYSIEYCSCVTDIPIDYKPFDSSLFYPTLRFKDKLNDTDLFYVYLIKLLEGRLFLLEYLYCMEELEK